MRLFLVDGIFVPGQGVWSFTLMGNGDAVEGIQRAFDAGVFVNLVATPEKALRLSRITNRNIGVGDPARSMSTNLETQVEPGDIVLLYHESPPEQKNGKRALHRHLWISAMSLDIFSAPGIAGLMARALPKGGDIVEWGSNIVAMAEQAIREDGDGGEVSDE